MRATEATTYTLGQIAERLGGEVIGNADVVLEQIASLHNAKSNQISFLSHGKYRELLNTTHAGAIILGAKDRDATTIPRIVCDDPYVYFARVSTLLNSVQRPDAGKHHTAIIEKSAVVDVTAFIGAAVYIGESARLGKDTIVEAGCCIGADVKIGDNCHIHANVSIYAGCEIGDNVILHSGAVIGADGFGIAMADGKWLKIPQIGKVIIGNDVEIGANTTIDRGAIDDTIIEEGVKLDNQIQVGHNVRIGAHTAIAGCVGIAGSAIIGRYCRIGGAAMILGHLHIADHVDISVGTLVTKSIDKPGAYSSMFPFSTHREWLKNASQLRHLDQMAETIKNLQKRLNALEGNES